MNFISFIFVLFFFLILIFLFFQFCQICIIVILFLFFTGTCLRLFRWFFVFFLEKLFESRRRGFVFLIILFLRLQNVRLHSFVHVKLLMINPFARLLTHGNNLWKISSRLLVHHTLCSDRIWWSHSSDVRGMIEKSKRV